MMSWHIILVYEDSLCHHSCHNWESRALDKEEYLMIILDNFAYKIRLRPLILHIKLGCDPSSEPSRRDGSDERSQHRFQ